jgi:hypothetical protein
MLGDAKESAAKMSEEYGGIPVDIVYEPSFGVIHDVLIAGAARFGLYRYRSSKLAAEHIRSRPDTNFTVHSHSRGSGGANQTFRRLSDTDYYRRTELYSFGAWDPTTVDLAKGRNFRAHLDPVALLGQGVSFTSHKIFNTPMPSIEVVGPKGWGGFTHSYGGDVYREQSIKLGDKFQSEESLCF